ncbi:MAG: recombination protein NinB, partial [Rhodospirillales bacterium]|nr:recombination protein NinB [Rhodospirillales bacterium]
LEPVHIEIKGATRSLEANAKMWAMLTDISSQVEWYGQRLCKEDFKTILTASLRKQRAVPGIDIGTFVILGDRTSEMTKAEMSELIELAYAFGAERGVVWSEADHDTGEIGRAA